MFLSDYAYYTLCTLWADVDGQVSFAGPERVKLGVKMGKVAAVHTQIRAPKVLDCFLDCVCFIIKERAL